jgi:hypothetical protein
LATAARSILRITVRNVGPSQDGSNEQMFGANDQIPHEGQSDQTEQEAIAAGWRKAKV